MIPLGLGAAQWPLDGGIYTTNITIPISNSPEALATGDDEFYFDTVSPGWVEFRFGLNNDGAALTQAAVNIDNLSLTANSPVPEPGSAVLGILGLALLARRRRP